ncbi:MAG: domain containing protein [Aeromicrobium sp.]|nr:domain containing protein [Aeromicrobium sp.]
MYVGGLWRYPVKSLQGERLATANLTDDGVQGDRIVHVRGAKGPLTGRTRHELLTISAVTGDDGVPRVQGHAWDTVEAAAIVQGAAGEDAALVAYTGPARFDIANLLVATDSAVGQFGHDIRRLRPNILIAGTAGQDEREWEGRALKIGTAVVGIYARRARCIVTSIDPDTGDQDLNVFRKIRAQFGGRLALDSWVITPGIIREGDTVELSDTAAEPEHLGGWIVGAPYKT